MVQVYWFLDVKYHVFLKVCPLNDSWFRLMYSKVHHIDKEYCRRILFVNLSKFSFYEFERYDSLKYQKIVKNRAEFFWS